MTALANFAADFLFFVLHKCTFDIEWEKQWHNATCVCVCVFVICSPLFFFVFNSILTRFNSILVSAYCAVTAVAAVFAVTQMVSYDLIYKKKVCDLSLYLLINSSSLTVPIIIKPPSYMWTTKYSVIVAKFINYIADFFVASRLLSSYYIVALLLLLQCLVLWLLPRFLLYF